jgi:hypothetical protein
MKYSLIYLFIYLFSFASPLARLRVSEKQKENVINNNNFKIKYKFFDI